MVEIISIIISLLALGFSLYQHFVYGRRIEKQQMQLNQLELERHQRENEDRKKACIRGNIIQGSRPGSRTLKIFNAGQSEARNIKVEWLDETDEIFIRDDFSVVGNLTPQNSRSFNMMLTEGHPKVMNLRYTWEDDYSIENSSEEQIQL